MPDESHTQSQANKHIRWWMAVWCGNDEGWRDAGGKVGGGVHRLTFALVTILPCSWAQKRSRLRYHARCKTSSGDLIYNKCAALLFSLFVLKMSPDQFATRKEKERERDSSVRVHARVCVCSGISIKDGSVARDEGARRQIHTFWCLNEVSDGWARRAALPNQSVQSCIFQATSAAAQEGVCLAAQREITDAPSAVCFFFFFLRLFFSDPLAFWSQMFFEVCGSVDLLTRWRFGAKASLSLLLSSPLIFPPR